MQTNFEIYEVIEQEAVRYFGTRAGVRSLSSGSKKQHGFTLVELITIMVIVGILAVAAAPRFFDANSFQSRGFNDQVISSLRYAQKVAIAQHRFVCVTIAANTISLAQGATAACGTPLPNISGAGNYSVAAPNGVTVGAAVFNFDALGKPSAGQTITVSGNTAITVEAETGYVH